MLNLFRRTDELSLKRIAHRPDAGHQTAVEVHDFAERTVNEPAVIFIEVEHVSGHAEMEAAGVLEGRPLVALRNFAGHREPRHIGVRILRRRAAPEHRIKRIIGDICHPGFARMGARDVLRTRVEGVGPLSRPQRSFCAPAQPFPGNGSDRRKLLP